MGGGDPYSAPLVRTLRRAGIRRLEALVLTHPDLDHIGGAPSVLEGLDVAAVGDPGRSRETRPYLDVLESTAAEPARWIALTRGDHLELDGVVLDVLHPSRSTPADADPNATSVVLLLRYGLFTALLTGDAPAEVEDALTARVGRVDVLKVAHHGSRTSSSDRFLGEVQPSLSVVSAGRRNRYGHPHADVTARLLRHSGAVLRTDLDGAVRIVARRDGEWEVHTERGGGSN
jgi:competence protein ComEC